MSNDHNVGQSSPNRPFPVESEPHSFARHLSDPGASPIAVIADSLAGQDLGYRQRSTVASPATKQSAVEFRVIRPGAPVRRLRLTGNRYTFGSGEGCSIRLDDESLRPMHAVLLRDAQRILMRAYSVPLECNGTRVIESELRLGDIIRMGHYRFELLTVPGSDATRGHVGQRGGTGPESRETYLRDRLTELSQQWHVRHAECEVRENRCDLREKELHGRETELWSRAETLQYRESLLIAQESAAREIQETYAATQRELTELRSRESVDEDAIRLKEAELIQQSEQLEERQAELERSQAELERSQAEWQTREQQHAERTAEAQRKLEQTQRQAQAASDSVGRMREEFSTLSEQLTELRERHSELQQREKREHEEHERLREQLESGRDEAIDSLARCEAERIETEKQLQSAAATLAATREELETTRQESKRCQQELSEKLFATGQELQSTREEAEKSRRAHEEDLAYSEKQVTDLEERLEVAQQGRAESDRIAQEEIAALRNQHQSAEKARLIAEITAEELRQSVSVLQQNVAQARQEAAQIQAEQEGSNASIRQLELLVDQTKNNQSAQQESWIHDSDQLRHTIEQLSDQLAAAQCELSKLQSANDALSAELSRSHSVAEQQLAARQTALDSEQFRALEAELDTARHEIESLQATHSETVSRLQAERTESESMLRDEIGQLRDEIAAAQRAAELRIQEIAAAAESRDEDCSVGEPNVWGPSVAVDESKNPSSEASHSWGTDTASTPITDSIVRSGDSLWRLESEQQIEPVSQLVEQEWNVADSNESGGADHHNTARDSMDSSQLSDAESGGASWQDEAPEHSIVDAIDDIEHNVEQVISDYDAVSTAKSTDQIDPDTPLDWSAYMPGGNVQKTAETHDDAEAQDDAEATGTPFGHDAIEQSSVAPINEAGAEANEWNSNEWPQTAEENQDNNQSVPYDPTQQWDQDAHDHSNPLSEIESESEPESDHSDEPAVGSLAAMLIRDLNADRNEKPSAALEADDDSSDATYLLEREISFTDEEPADEEGSWNFASPDREDLEDSLEDHDESDTRSSLVNDEELEQDDLSLTAVASNRDTVVVKEQDAPDDDSIEAYMSRLLQRVQGETATLPASPVTETKTQRAPAKGTDTHEVATHESIATEPTKSTAKDSSPLVPRSQAPELSRNLSAMRELANQSARNAVARSIRIQARDTQMKSAVKAGLSACFAAMALGVFLFVSWSSTIKIAMIGAFLVLAAVIAQESYILWRDARRRLTLADSGSEDPQDDKAFVEEIQRIADEYKAE